MKIPFFNKKQETRQINTIPEHVAIIMDGNGRWANKRGLPRIAGHREGAKVIKKITSAAVNNHIETLTLYAFSTENWKRPQSEIDFLMKLPKEFLNSYLPELNKNNVRLSTIGEIQNLPEETRKIIDYAIDKTKNNNGLLLNFALNYGSRSEILHAVKNMIADVDAGKLYLDSLNEDMLSSYLYTGGLKDPDLLIRTSGEQRLSNFLLWQLAYTEFWFTDVLWPDFDETKFEEAINHYNMRKRRYGGI